MRTEVKPVEVRTEVEEVSVRSEVELVVLVRQRRRQRNHR